MIDKVEILNFTTQKKCDIEFGPYVTTLVGSSFTGKSTILRAIRFACMNKPSGDKMISWGKEKTRVRVTIDGKKITRRKGKNINSYKLGKDIFKAFGNNVPQPIAHLVNMGDLNFQGQHDKPFWFCETSGEVSRQLNKIVDLEVIDKTLSNLDGGVRDAKAEIKLTTKRLEDAETAKKELAFAVSLDADLSHIEKLEKTAREKAVESTRLCDIVKSGSKYRRDRKNARSLAVGGETALEIGKEWSKIRDKGESLKIVLKSALQEQKRIDACPPDIIEVDGYYQVLQNHKESRETLENLILEIETGETKLWERKNEAETATSVLTKATKGKCPICLRPMER